MRWWSCPECGRCGSYLPRPAGAAPSESLLAWRSTPLPWSASALLCFAQAKTQPETVDSIAFRDARHKRSLKAFTDRYVLLSKTRKRPSRDDSSAGQSLPRMTLRFGIAFRVQDRAFHL